ncbi:hypothetical protein A3Q56_02178 [Intoshia linei]|uniref:Endonuclease/exonuclease/phosphatase domain-containing protein n=1 Tax=Intoshia linei TaxID=1819745 RepID=A0A177B6Z6_9BILA|nr:hypothetical protein A3Q56_02178 [Intoshia linei]
MQQLHVNNLMDIFGENVKEYRCGLEAQRIQNRKFKEIYMLRMEQSCHVNIMHDKRIVRGNTYAKCYVPFSQVLSKKKLKLNRTKKPVNLMTMEHPNRVLEEITDRDIEIDDFWSSELYYDRPPSPKYEKPGIFKNAATEILPNELFNFDIQVIPILQFLVGTTIEKSLVEVSEENELKEMRCKESQFHFIRNIEISEREKLIQQNQRSLLEKKHRLNQTENIIEIINQNEQKNLKNKMVNSYVSGLTCTVLNTLKNQGVFYDPIKMDVKLNFIPWLTGETIVELSRRRINCMILDEIIKNILKIKKLLMYKNKRNLKTLNQSKKINLNADQTDEDVPLNKVKSMISKRDTILKSSDSDNVEDCKTKKQILNPHKKRKSRRNSNKSKNVQLMYIDLSITDDSSTYSSHNLKKTKTSKRITSKKKKPSTKYDEILHENSKNTNDNSALSIEPDISSNVNISPEKLSKSKFSSDDYSDSEGNKKTKENDISVNNISSGASTSNNCSDGDVVILYKKKVKKERKLRHAECTVSDMHKIKLSSTYTSFRNDSFKERTFIDYSDKLNNVDPSKTFSVVSYNILAQGYTQLSNFPWLPYSHLRNITRLPILIDEIRALNANVVCMQEVEGAFLKSHLEGAMAMLGYKCVSKMRSYINNKLRYIEGCATFYKNIKLKRFNAEKLTDIFENSMKKYNINSNDHRVVSKLIKKMPDVILTSEFEFNGKTFIVANTHINYADFVNFNKQVFEVISAVEYLKQFKSNNVPIVICGDFNSVPESAMYSFMTTGKVSKDQILQLRKSYDAVNVDDEKKSLLDFIPDEMNQGIKFTDSYANYVNNIGTAYNSKWEKFDYMKTIDYIFYEEDKLDLVGIMKTTAKKHFFNKKHIPSRCVPSDHLSLKSVFQFK